MSGKAEPRFDLDLRYGKQGEKKIEELLGWVVHGNLRVEVKTKRYLDHQLYVETHCDKGRTGVYRPSGILATTSQVWVFVLGETGIHVAIPTTLLREALNYPSTEDRETTHGTCPTRGKLVDFAVLLHNLKKKIERNGGTVPDDVACPECGRDSCEGHTEEFKPPTHADIRW